jgi:hypothetical protein
MIQKLQSSSNIPKMGSPISDDAPKTRTRRQILAQLKGFLKALSSSYKMAGG